MVELLPSQCKALGLVLNSGGGEDDNPTILSKNRHINICVCGFLALKSHFVFCWIFTNVYNKLKGSCQNSTFRLHGKINTWLFVNK